MKSKLFVVGTSFLLAFTVSACNTSDSSMNDSSQESVVVNEENSSDTSFTVENPQELDYKALEIIRNSFNVSDREIAEKGGVRFDLIDPNSDITTSFDIGYDGSGYQETIIQEDQIEKFYWSADTLYTPVEFINEEVKEYVLKVNNDAEWFSEPKSTQFSLITPTRIVESFLAYAKQVSCQDNNATTDCSVIATGITYLPGLGGFDPPQDEVKMNLSINNETGLIQNIVLFPGQEGLERIIANIIYQQSNIDYPAENVTVTFDQTTEQILLDNPMDDDSPDSLWRQGDSGESNE